MEVPTAENRKTVVAIYELIGTALFVYMIIMSTGNPIAVPLSLFAMVVLFGDITGGHFNPAVTLGVYVWLGEFSKNFTMALVVIVSQLIGSLLGMGLAILTLASDVDGDYQVPEQYVPILCPKDPSDPSKCEQGSYQLTLQLWATQTICTFVFVSVILMVKGQYTSPSTDGALKAMAVVLTLGGLIQVANHTAASFNPAVTAGLTAFQNYVLVNSDQYLTHYMTGYFFGPLLGGLLAGIFAHSHHGLHDPVKKAEAAGQQDTQPAKAKSGFSLAAQARREAEDRQGLIQQSV